MKRQELTRRGFLTAASSGIASAGAISLTSANMHGEAPASAPAGAGLVPITAFQKDSKILFQGDSITDGNRGRGADPNHILGHGYVFIIAARHGAAFAERNLDFINRGISGHTVLDLEKRWQKDTLDLKPTLLSVLIGVNDNSKGVELAQYERVYDKLLSDARAANPKLKLVLCEPFGYPMGKKKEIWGVWGEGIRKRGAIVASLAQKYQAAMPMFQRALDEASKRAPLEHWCWDGVHPTYSGHQILADEWERAVREFWPA